MLYVFLAFLHNYFGVLLLMPPKEVPQSLQTVQEKKKNGLKRGFNDTDAMFEP